MSPKFFDNHCQCTISHSPTKSSLFIFYLFILKVSLKIDSASKFFSLFSPRIIRTLSLFESNAYPVTNKILLLSIVYLSPKEIAIE